VETAVGYSTQSTITLVLNSRYRIDTMLSKRFIQLDHSVSSREKGSTDDATANREGPASPPRAPALSLRNAAPFVPAHDFARGAMMIFQTAITYALMLTAMYVLTLPFHRQSDNVSTGRSMLGSLFPFSSDWALAKRLSDGSVTRRRHTPTDSLTLQSHYSLSCLIYTNTCSISGSIVPPSQTL